ncbi:MAG: transglutaminase domain-containing protein [Cyclobacteriaceae bacterium]|nr:transglutaminase domain-containing protein [Cyclobacteriaceae bacterium]
MKNNFILPITLGILLIACNPGEYQVTEVSNPRFIPNTVFLSAENLGSPKFRHLIVKYQLDTVFHGETDEFRRILMLRHWIKSIIKIDDFGDPYPGDGFTEGILDAALEGQGFHCGHFMTVQNGIMNAYGYVTRPIGAGPGVKGGPDGHHGINEIWLNDRNKWFLSDAKYDHHFEKNGNPLSALEVRDEYLKNKGADVVLVKGPDRKFIETDDETGNSKENYMQTYTWIEWHVYNDMFTAWPDYETLLVMYEDDYYRNNTWIWDGKPHWAYNTEYLITEKNREAIEWTPNTLSSKAVIAGDKVSVILVSNTPNLKEYQMKLYGRPEWDMVKDTVEISLGKEDQKIIFRTVNLAGVAGPEHELLIRSQ